jgi:ribosomal protein S18 acetylase RimI-like enzyme
VSRAVTIRAADLPRDLPDIERLCWAYRETLPGLRPDVARAVQQHYDPDSYSQLMQDLPVKQARPKGSILLADTGGTLVGCGMIQPLSDADAEIKRVYIDPLVQGKGVGESLTRALIEQARKDGYDCILLDTTRTSISSRKLYEKLGFSKRGPYAEMPEDIAALMVFCELVL